MSAFFRIDPAEARGDVLEAEVLGAEVALERRLEVALLGAVERLGAQREALVAAVRLRASALDDRVAQAELRRLVAHVFDRDGLRGVEGRLAAAAEVDPEVQALDRQRGQADHHHGSRDAEPELALPDEVDLLPGAGSSGRSRP